LHQKKTRALGNVAQIRQLDERIDYLEGMIYQLFQLTERLLETVEKLRGDETPPASTHTQLMALMTVMGGC